MMPTRPLIRDITHGFGRTIAYPGHELTVKLEFGTALVQQEAPDVFGVFIANVDAGLLSDDDAVPLENDEGFFPFFNNRTRFILD